MRRSLRLILALLLFWPGQLGCALANLRRRFRHHRIPAFVQINIGERVVERPARVPFLLQRFVHRARPQSLEELRRDLLAVARDPAPAGIVLRIDRTDLTLARAQSLVQLLEEFRQADRRHHAGAGPKQIICYLFQCNAPCYLVGTAADRLYISPVTIWDVTGVFRETHYLQRFLARWGVEFDVVRAGRWKTAPNPLTRTYMDADERSHMTGVMASLHSQLVAQTGQHRGLSRTAVQAAVDQAPLLPAEALQHNLVDKVCTWSMLSRHLAPHALSTARLMAPLEEVRPLLRRVYRRKHPKRIAVIQARGIITWGTASSWPPRQQEVCSHHSLLAAIRTAERRKASLAGVILHIDSPGGSALASHVLYDALRDLAQKLPLVVYMGSMAASGGYYLAMAGAHVIAQAATVTGSIGVFASKPVVARALGQFGIHTAQLQQGANAAIHSASASWSDTQRRRMQKQVEHFYRDFRQVVQEGRNMEAGRAEEMAGGRVWTGWQARERNLVDEIGDFARAVAYIRAEARIPSDRHICVESLHTKSGASSLYPALAHIRLLRHLAKAVSLWAPAVEATAPECAVWMLADELADL